MNNTNRLQRDMVNINWQSNKGRGNYFILGAKLMEHYLNVAHINMGYVMKISPPQQAIRKANGMLGFYFSEVEYKSMEDLPQLYKTSQLDHIYSIVQFWAL